MREIHFVTMEGEVFKLPYIETGIAINQELQTEEFETVLGKKLTLVGETGNRSLSIESFFPNKRYRFLSSGEKLLPECLEFFEIHRKEVMRIVYTSGDLTLCNMLCTILSYSFFPKPNGDYSYSLSIKEYIDPETIG